MPRKWGEIRLEKTEEYKQDQIKNNIKVSLNKFFGAVKAWGYSSPHA